MLTDREWTDVNKEFIGIHKVHNYPTSYEENSCEADNFFPKLK